MCSLYRFPVAENHNFGQFLTFGVSCTNPLLPVRVKFGVLEQTQGLHYHAKFHLNGFIVSASSGQKPQFCANFDFWGLLYHPFLPMRVKFGVLEQTHGVRLRAKFRLDQFILSPSGGKKSQFLPFLPYFGSAFSGVASWQQSEKVEHGCTLHVFGHPGGE